MGHLILLDELKRIIHYNPDTGIFVWKVNRGGKAKRGSIAGTAAANGYMRIWVKSRPIYTHRLAWFYVNGEWPRMEIDHIDRNKENNRISNLREVTRSQNVVNVGVSSHNTSGFRGVSYIAQSGKWLAQITYNRKKTFLGYHKTPELANEAYQKAAKETFGEYFPN